MTVRAESERTGVGGVRLESERTPRERAPAHRVGSGRDGTTPLAGELPPSPSLPTSTGSPRARKAERAIESLALADLIEWHETEVRIAENVLANHRSRILELKAARAELDGRAA